MRFSPHFLRRVVIPVLTLALIIVPAYNWLRAGRVPGRYAERCQAAVFESDAPPADLLLVGASRTGMGIDDDIVDRARSGKSPHRTEKIVLPGNAESDANLALRTYLHERGTPEVLGIELLLSRQGGDSSAPRSGAALTGRSVALFGVDAYAGYVDGLVEKDVIARDDVYLRSHFPTPIAFFFDRLQIGFDNAYRALSETFDPLADCDATVHPMWEPVAAIPYTDASPKPSAQKVENLDKEVERYVKVDIDSARAFGELAVVRDMVDIARAAGVEKVFLYYFPSWGETSDMIDLDRVGELVPTDGMFDVRPVLADPAKPGLDLQFRDRAHLTKYGAHEVTQALVGFLEELDNGGAAK